MAVTSIWPINAGKRSVASAIRVVVDYAMNPEKTTENLSPEVSALHTIDNVVQYAASDLKTETKAYVTCIGCTSPERISGKQEAACVFMDTNPSNQVR